MLDNSSNYFLIGNAITPLDGRNSEKIKDLGIYFSESALNKYRVIVELKYLEKLSQWKVIRLLAKKEKELISQLINNFSDKDYLEIKDIEKVINHDVKAVEYFIREKLKKTSMKDLLSYVHFGLTSDDTNNLAYGLMLKDFKEKTYKKEIMILIDKLRSMAKEYKDVPLLARTHGQPAVSTTVGKELINYYYRLIKQYKKINDFKFEGKCNGAVGNNNALKVALPTKNWTKLSKEFVNSLGLIENPYTVQILFYDNWLEFFQIVHLVNGILIDLCQNFWYYIMLEEFVQKKKEDEVGSSTMPQKVNPINFENGEGNLGVANSMLEFFQRKLPISRLQRDLSDSTIRRNFGESLSYSVLGYRSIFFGLKKVFPNKEFLKKELENHWEILTEAIQTVLRLKKDDKAYEKLKKLTRGKTIDLKGYKGLLKDLGLDKDKRLKDLTPEKYTGYAADLVEKINKLKL